MFKIKFKKKYKIIIYKKTSFYQKLSFSSIAYKYGLLFCSFTKQRHLSSVFNVCFVNFYNRYGSVSNKHPFPSGSIEYNLKFI